ncbi:MAG: fibronectin type III domain-containing protein [Bacteroidetes bacterium]|nr:fibronectin type III domain-containing protein [Bacteroidota bacterium]
MKRFKLLIIFLLVVTAMLAQHPSGLKQTSTHLGIIGKHGSEGIVLRWAPKNFAVWQIASTSRYILERAEWDESQWPFAENKLKYNKIGDFRALPQQEWETKADINDPLVAVAAQSLFGNEATRAMPASGLADLRLVADLQENRHAMAMFAADLSGNAAAALGLVFYDKDVEAGRQYIYRLRTTGNKAGFGADTVWHYTTYDGIPTPAQSVQSVQTVSGHARVDVMWDRPGNAARFTAFYVERSSDNKTFTRLNNLPLTSATGDDQPEVHLFRDTTATIGKRYFYRVVGITPFAETSAPGESVPGMARDMEGPLPPQKTTVVQADNSFVIEWEIENQLIAPDAIGWSVKRSINASGPYQSLHDKVLPLRQRRFTDNNPVPVITNYYRVYAVDTAGNETPGLIQAAIWVDSIPPAAPAGLSAKVDSTGVVHIYWNPGLEADLQGYRVFVRDDRNKDWYQLTSRPIVENSFTDTVDLKSLSRSIQYTVVATDFHYNTSPYAPAFTLRLPDLVAPSAPRWAPWSVEDDKVKLNWYPSAASDVRVHRLIRTSEQGRFKLYRDFKPGENSTLASLTPGQPSSFALVAIDSVGNVSDTAFLRNVMHTKASRLPAVRGFKAKPDAAQRSILLEWSYDTRNDVWFNLYRKKPDGDELEFVGRFDAASRSYTDRGPSAFRQGFDYYLKAVAADGSESEWAGPLRMRF